MTQLLFDTDEVRKSATISECGLYRYTLGRSWGDGPRVNFVMLNPSMADASEDDPTIRRCIDFSKRWGYGEIVVTNLYGLRSTDPKALWKHFDPIGPENDAHIEREARDSDLVVCAWGNHGQPIFSGKKWTRGRGPIIVHKLRSWGLEPYALRRTSTLEPSHPLYLPSYLHPVPIDESPRPEVAWPAADFDPSKEVQS